jgi:Ca2+-binding EF-hand superfamily protein
MAEPIVPSLENNYLFTTSEVAGFKAQFDAFDEDGGGTIENKELKTVLKACGMVVTEAQVQEMIQEFDTDGNGELDFGEFLGMMYKFQSGPTEKDLRKTLFEVRPQEGSGLLRAPRTPLRARTRAASAFLAPPHYTHLLLQLSLSLSLPSFLSPGPDF